MKISALRRTFGSIAFKISVIILAVGLSTVAAVAIALVVFGSLAASIEEMMNEELPNMQASVEVMAASGAASDALADLSRATSQDEIGQTWDTLLASVEALNSAVAALPAASSERIEPMLAGLEEAKTVMLQSMEARWSAEARMRQDIAAFVAISEDARASLTELADDAYFDLTLGGEETVGAVRGTLSSLVEREFTTIQAVLNMRAEINLVTGAALALTQTSDPALAAILRDVASGGLARLSKLETEVSGNQRVAEDLQAVFAARAELQALADRNFARRPGLQETLLSLRQSSDSALSETIDTMSFSLVILAEDTADENEQTIRSLLENEVGRIRYAAEIDASVNRVFVTALLGSSADTIDAVDGAQVLLNEAASQLAALNIGGRVGDEFQALVARIAAAANQDTGLLAARCDFVQATAAAAARADEANAALAGISRAARDEGASAVQAMTAAGARNLEDTSKARGEMYGIAGIAAVILLLSPLISWLLILRPMGRVTRVTERLATGDLAPVTGFERTGGEVGRMAAALAVFRNGMIGRAEMQELERRREAERAEELRVAEEEERRREEEAAADRARRAEEEREREAREAARQAELERAAAEEREARAAEQALVVDTLADALKRLSDGDLRVAIDTRFADVYEDLRANFNAAVRAVSDLIGNLIDGASTVHTSSENITNGAREQARQAESNAASLEETAAAVTELDASARMTSETAEAAHRVMTDARREAEETRKAVEAAVSTMSEIETSSEAVSKIVDLIESIAFQTNLLALNAGVEAARAGEQGRGFAVVANEVRGLAQRASEAANDINGLITETRGQITRGVSQVNDAGKALAGILSLIGEISDNIEAIAVGAREQAGTVSEINSAVAGIDATVQKSAISFQASLSASELLRNKAQELRAHAMQFRVQQNQSDPETADAPGLSRAS